ASIVFEAYPDAAPALEDLRGRGIRLVAASNWDCSLPRVLDRAGLGALLDGVVSSATVGARKPDAALFEAALVLAGCSAAAAGRLTVALEAIFVASAILCASMTERPRPPHFGLRRAPFWRTLGWAALGMLCFWIFSASYTALVKSHGKQTVLQDLHARDSTS